MKRIYKAALLAALVVAQTATMAQPSPVTITYGPDVASVPTLSEWGMIIMAVLLAAAAYIAMSKRSGSKTVMSIALAALLSFGGGIYAIKDAVAGIAQLVLNNPAGGSLITGQGGLVTTVRNDTAIRMRILSVSNPAIHNNPTGCVPGTTVLNTNETCTVLTDGSGID